MSTGSFDGSGNFSMTHNMDSSDTGKYVVNYYATEDKSGNYFNVNGDDGGSGSPLLDLTFTYAEKPTAITLAASTIEEEALGSSLGVVKVNRQILYQ